MIDINVEKYAASFIRLRSINYTEEGKAILDPEKAKETYLAANLEALENRLKSMAFSKRP